MVGGGVHGRVCVRGDGGGHVWQWACVVGGMCVAGGMHGRGACVAGGMHGRRGACMVGGHA